MKKIILSLSALMLAAIASAQSYPKQPDRSVVTYVEYKKAAKEESESEAKQEMVQISETGESDQAEAAIQPAASVNATTVSENRNNKARKQE